MRIFLVVAILIVLGVHAYMWLRLAHSPRWSRRAKIAITLAFVPLTLLVPVAMPLVRQLPREQIQPLATLAYGWMGLGFLLFTVIFLSDLLRWLVSGARSLAAIVGRRPIEPLRRVPLARAVAIAAPLLAILLGAKAVHGAWDVGVKEVEVKLDRLPPSLDGFRLVHLTDLHIGPILGRGFTEKVVELTNAQNADLIVITGDLVDMSVEELEEHVAPLAKLRAKHGVVFITGNHEYYSGARPWIEHLPKLGMRVLANEHIPVGDGDDVFLLAGVNDYAAVRRGGGLEGPDFDKALAGRDPSREVVLLSHQPKAIYEAAPRDVGLVLAGHTHGGQLWPFTWLVHLEHQYVAGLHRHEGTDAQIYVSRGTGFWGPPMRLGAPSEIATLVLRSGQAAAKVSTAQADPLGN